MLRYVMLCYVILSYRYVMYVMLWYFFGTLDFGRSGVWEVWEFGTLGPWDLNNEKIVYKKNGKTQALQKGRN